MCPLSCLTIWTKVAGWDFLADLTTVKARSMTHPRKIIIDTDPGQDDAVAILLALVFSTLLAIAAGALAFTAVARLMGSEEPEA